MCNGGLKFSQVKKITRFYSSISIFLKKQITLFLFLFLLLLLFFFFLSSSWHSLGCCFFPIKIPPRLDGGDFDVQDGGHHLQRHRREVSGQRETYPYHHKNQANVGKNYHTWMVGDMLYLDRLRGQYTAVLLYEICGFKQDLFTLFTL